MKVHIVYTCAVSPFPVTTHSCIQRTHHKLKFGGCIFSCFHRLCRPIHDTTLPCFVSADTLFYLTAQNGQSLPPRKVKVLLIRKEVIVSESMFPLGICSTNIAIRGIASERAKGASPPSPYTKTSVLVRFTIYEHKKKK